MGEIIGRFHPLIVHLPIGIVIATFIIELASRSQRFNHLKSAVSFLLLLCIITSVISWFTGWIMPKEGLFDEDVVRLHFWFSLSMTLMTVVLYFIQKSKNPQLHKLYLPLFIVTMVLLVLTGYNGGSLTHGDDYLSQSSLMLNSILEIG